MQHSSDYATSAELLLRSAKPTLPAHELFSSDPPYANRVTALLNYRSITSGSDAVQRYVRQFIGKKLFRTAGRPYGPRIPSGRYNRPGHLSSASFGIEILCHPGDRAK